MVWFTILTSNDAMMVSYFTILAQLSTLIHSTSPWPHAALLYWIEWNGKSSHRLFYVELSHVCSNFNYVTIEILLQYNCIQLGLYYNWNPAEVSSLIIRFEIYLFMEIFILYVNFVCNYDMYIFYVQSTAIIILQ